MKNLPKNFTKNKVKLLIENYPIKSKIEVEKLFPEYSWRSLQNIAGFLKLKKEYSEIRKGDLSILLDNSVLSSYWLGLFASDGCITEDCTFKIDLQLKDKKYLEQLSLYLNTSIKEYPRYNSSKPGGTGICRIKIRDKVYGTKIKDIFYQNGLKTYNPVNIDFLKNTDNFLSFLIGYIDGDGSIDKQGRIVVDGHINIEPLFINIINDLKKLNSNFKLSLTKYQQMIRMNFNTECSAYLNTFRKQKSLPILKRKWERI